MVPSIIFEIELILPDSTVGGLDVPPQKNSVLILSLTDLAEDLLMIVFYMNFKL